MTKKRICVTDCEGPLSKNDNAFELTRNFIPAGEKLYKQISRYDDVQADIVKRRDYKAGDTLKLILPFLKAYNVTNKKMIEFSAQNIMLISGAKETLTFLRNTMPSFIISTSYEHYIRVLCLVSNFPFENTYCTKLDIDNFSLGKGERERIKKFTTEICTMLPIKIPTGAKSFENLTSQHQETIERLDEIFWEEIAHMNIGKILLEVDPVGGVEKANSITKIVKQLGSSLKDVIYVGDSITDVECFRLVRKKGGTTVSFNGNAYAVRDAEIAVLSKDAIALAVIADVFNKFGNESVLKIVDNWGHEALKWFNIDPWLQERIEKTFRKTLPKMVRINSDNMEKIAVESCDFRRHVRGENVGSLG